MDKNRKGFTLVEIMVAMVLIVIIVTVGFEAYRYAKIFVRDSKLRLMAVNFAQETMEKLYFAGNLAEQVEPRPDPFFPDSEGLEDLEAPDRPKFKLLLDTHHGARNYTVKSNISELNKSGVEAVTDEYMIIETNVHWD